MTFIDQSLDGFKEIFASLFNDLSVWWILGPVFIFWVVLEIYFGKHKSEELGWNTALGNGISLSWITLNLMKFLFENNLKMFTWPKFLLTFLIMIYGFFIAYIAFTHKFSDKTTFLLASPSPIYYLASIAILWSYGVLDISLIILFDLVILYLIIIGILALIKKYIPDAKDFLSDKGSESFSDLGL